ncbi:hypothetical protein RT94_04900 [Pseudomonas viridiflava]|nr:hypothetical protein RT94_04900 [Pseudomonas viridiflava]
MVVLPLVFAASGRGRLTTPSLMDQEYGVFASENQDPSTQQTSDVLQVPKKHSLMTREISPRMSSTNFSQWCVHFIGRTERAGRNALNTLSKGGHQQSL